MRITNRMISNNYMANLNTSLGELTKLNDKVSAGRSYLKASEDPATALKALAVRQNLSRISLYQNNIAEAGDLLTDTEAAISETNSVISNVVEQVLQGKSDTFNDDDRNNIAQLLKNYQAEIFDIANSKSSNKYIFGGSQMNEAPFTLNNGTLSYHGVDVNSNAAMDKEEIYFDIGLGLKTDLSNQVVEGTAFNISNPGSEIFGMGTDSNGLSNNFYNLLGDIADHFSNNDLSNIDGYVSKLEEVGEKVTIQYVNVGQKTNFLDFLTTRLGANEYNAQAKQGRLEGIDEAEGILNYKTQEVAYNAALAMGSKIIQSSLLDYMR